MFCIFVALEFSNVASTCINFVLGFMCADAMKGRKGKIRKLSLTTASNFPTGLLIGLGGFQSGTVGGRV